MFRRRRSRSKYRDKYWELYYKQSMFRRDNSRTADLALSQFSRFSNLSGFTDTFSHYSQTSLGKISDTATFFYNLYKRFSFLLRYKEIRYVINDHSAQQYRLRTGNIDRYYTHHDASIYASLYSFHDALTLSSSLRTILFLDAAYIPLMTNTSSAYITLRIITGYVISAKRRRHKNRNKNKNRSRNSNINNIVTAISMLRKVHLHRHEPPIGICYAVRATIYFHVSWLYLYYVLAQSTHETVVRIAATRMHNYLRAYVSIYALSYLFTWCSFQRDVTVRPKTLSSANRLLFARSNSSDVTYHTLDALEILSSFRSRADTEAIRYVHASATRTVYDTSRKKRVKSLLALHAYNNGKCFRKLREHRIRTTFLPSSRIRRYITGPSKCFVPSLNKKYRYMHRILTYNRYHRYASILNALYSTCVTNLSISMRYNNIYRMARTKLDLHNKIIRNSYKRIFWMLRRKIYSFFHGLFRRYPTKRRLSVRVTSIIFFRLLKKILFNKRYYSFTHIRKFIAYSLYVRKRYSGMRFNKRIRQNSLKLMRKQIAFMDSGGISIHLDKAKYAFFFMRHLNITFKDFASLCKRAIHGSLYDVLLVAEASLFNLISNNFWTFSIGAAIFVNNKMLGSDTNSRLKPVHIGDIIESRRARSSTTSTYVESHILLFNILLLSKLRIIRNLLYTEWIHYICPILLNGTLETVGATYTFYPNWSFRSHIRKPFHRPLHYYFASLPYKSYMPWLSFSLFNVPTSRRSFLSFVNKLEDTHKIFITNMLGYLAFNSSFTYSTNWHIEYLMYNNLYDRLCSPAVSGNWCASLGAAQVIRAIISTRIFHSYTYSRTYSNKYIINATTIRNSRLCKLRSKHYIAQSRSYLRYGAKTLSLSHFRPEKKRVIKNFDFKSPELIYLREHKRLKPLPAYIYSFHRRFHSDQTYGTSYTGNNLGRRFFILHSSFAFMYQRMLASSPHTDSSVAYEPLFNYKAFYSSLLSNMFNAPYSRFSFKSVVKWFRKYKYRFGSFDRNEVSLASNRKRFTRFLPGLHNKYSRFIKMLKMPTGKLRKARRHKRAGLFLFRVVSGENNASRYSPLRFVKNKLRAIAEFKRRNRRRPRRYRRKGPSLVIYSTTLYRYYKFIMRSFFRRKFRFVKRFISGSFLGSHRYLQIRRLSRAVILRKRGHYRYYLRRKAVRHRRLLKKLYGVLTRRRWRSSAFIRNAASMFVCPILGSGVGATLSKRLLNPRYTRLSGMPIGIKLSRISQFVPRSFSSKFIYDALKLIYTDSRPYALGLHYYLFKFVKSSGAVVLFTLRRVLRVKASRKITICVDASSDAYTIR
jgi:hypothetical protein